MGRTKRDREIIRKERKKRWAWLRSRGKGAEPNNIKKGRGLTSERERESQKSQDKVR